MFLYLQEAEKKRKVERIKQKRWQEKHRRFMFGLLNTDDEKDDKELDREPIPAVPSRLRQERRLSRPPSTVSIPRDRGGSTDIQSSDNEERRGSKLSLGQILERKPAKKSKLAKDSEGSDDSGSDSDTIGTSGPEESYDLLHGSLTQSEPPDTPPESTLPPVPVAVIRTGRGSSDDSEEERSLTTKL